MSYRPEGWEETLRTILDSFNVTYMNSDECKLIEAGADAMLDGLRKKAVTLRIAEQDIDIPGFDIVFIPEGDDEK